MKRIIVPKDITLKSPLENKPGETISFQTWAFRHWMNHPEAAGSVVDLLRWGPVVEQFKSAKSPGDKITIEDQDHATLAKIVNKTATIEAPLVAMQLLPFVQAVLEAEDFKASDVSATSAAAVS